MPFKSEEQRRWMWANLPATAERWEQEKKRRSRKQSRKSKKRKGKRSD